MTDDLDNLRKLIEVVEAGTLTETECLSNGNKLPMCATMWDAFSNSLDAAITLCEVLLPEWAIKEMASWPGLPCRVSLWGTHEVGDERWHKFEDGRVDVEGPTLARALLLAVLRAKLMEVENETRSE